MENKTTWMKIKDSLPMALTSAVIVIILMFIIFSLFKLVPSFITNGSSYFASTLNSIFVPNQKIEEEVPAVVATTTVTKTVVQKVVPQYYGKSDLAIKLIGTGIVDKTTNQFYQTNYSGFNDTAGIKFEIVNIGTNVSGTFMVRLNLPSRTLPYYDSVRQISLRPGDKIEYVASFDSPIALGINTAYITADPLNEIDESSENNNALVVPVKIDSSSYSYNNNNYATAYNPNP
ncbi:MAG: CARDB domain-containing protein, partial [bacterium]